MSFETAGDLAGYFDDDMGAVAATFTPTSGPAVSCTILLDQPDETSGVGIAGVGAYNTRLMVRLSEIADPSGGTFTFTSAAGTLTYAVADANLDALQVIWTCLLRPTT